MWLSYYGSPNGEGGLCFVVGIKVICISLTASDNMILNACE